MNKILLFLLFCIISVCTLGREFLLKNKFEKMSNTEHRIFRLDLSSKYRKELVSYSNNTNKIVYFCGFNSQIYLSEDLGKMVRLGGFATHKHLGLSREEFVSLVNRWDELKLNDPTFFIVLHQSVKKWKKTKQRLVVRASGGGGLVVMHEEMVSKSSNEDEAPGENRVCIDSNVEWEEAFEKFFISPTDDLKKMGKNLRQWITDYRTDVFPNDHDRLLANIFKTIPELVKEVGKKKTGGKRASNNEDTGDSSGKKKPRSTVKPQPQKQKPRIEVDALVILFEYYQKKKCKSFEETCLRYSEEMYDSLCEEFEHESCNIDYIYDIYKKFKEEGLIKMYEKYKINCNRFISQSDDETDEEHTEEESLVIDDD